MLLEVRREANFPLLFGTVILVFLSIFTKRKASSPFEAVNTAHLSMSKGCEALCPEEVAVYAFL